MNLNMIDDIGRWFEKTMKNLENLVVDNYNEPLFWIFLVVIILAVVAAAFNALSGK